MSDRSSKTGPWYIETSFEYLYICSQGCSIPHTWWRHQMETFSALLALCAGNSPVPVNSPHKGQWRGALIFSLICARLNDWVNNREAGDFRHHRDHYDVIVMKSYHCETYSQLTFLFCLWPWVLFAIDFLDSVIAYDSTHLNSHIP